MLAIAACGSSTGPATRTLTVEATGPQLIDDQNGPPSYLVQGVGGGLLYAQNDCPPQGSLRPRFRLYDLGTRQTRTYPCSTTVVASARGQLLAVGPGGRGELSAPGRPTRRIELPAHTVASAVAPDGNVFYVKDVGGGRVCIGRVDPGQGPAGSCPPITLPGGDVPGQFVISATGAPVLIPVPSYQLTDQAVLQPVTFTSGRYVIARNEVPEARCAPVQDLWVAAAGDGSVWMTCNLSPPYPMRLSPDGRTLSGVPGVQGRTGLDGAAADADGNVWTIATVTRDITVGPDAPVLLRYRARGGRPTIFISPNGVDDVAGDPENRLWIVDDNGAITRFSLPDR